MPSSPLVVLSAGSIPAEIRLWTEPKTKARTARKRYKLRGGDSQSASTTHQWTTLVQVSNLGTPLKAL